MTELARLEQFLQTDPRDLGCAHALDLLAVYADLIAGGGGSDAERLHPDVAAHLHACGPCAEDLRALLDAIVDGPQA